MPVLLALVVAVSGPPESGLGAACASSDVMLEKESRLRELEQGALACPGEITEDCYSGGEATRGRGACTPGSRACKGGLWGECEGEVLPNAELCNGIDDDCDGIVDNGFEREGALCVQQDAKGACRTQGRWHCSVDERTNRCDAPIVLPQAETCDAVDNDCDGDVDENASSEERCSTGRAGVCEAGTERCVGGRVLCVQDVQPSAEICNRLDDDCDDSVDEWCARPGDDP